MMAKKIDTAKPACQEAAPDEYRDMYTQRHASLMEAYIGEGRENRYKEWFVQTLRDHNCVKVLDVACGTGVDSRMLIGEGFKVTSCDLSENMLDVARNFKKARRYSDWVIRQADWMKLPTELNEISHNFDAVICMGSSFSLLPDDLNKQEKQQKKFEETVSDYNETWIQRACRSEAITNFHSMLKPGGILIIDHRNFDYIIKNGRAPAQDIYYKPLWNYKVDWILQRNSTKEVTSVGFNFALTVPKDVQQQIGLDLDEDNDQFKGQGSHFPHYLEKFTSLLLRAFEYGANDTTAPHQIFGDFAPIESAKDPGYFIHVIKKQESPLISTKADR